MKTQSEPERVERSKDSMALPDPVPVLVAISREREEATSRVRGSKGRARYLREPPPVEEGSAGCASSRDERYRYCAREIHHAATSWKVFSDPTL